MAIVPRYTPEVQANTGGPALLDPSANPDAAGAGIARALGAAGAQADNLGEQFQAHAIRMATLDMKAASDKAAVDLDGALNQAILDYKDKNPGIAAVNNLPQMYKQMDALRQQYGANLTAPMAKMMYDEATRLNTEKMQNGLGTWAAGERKTYNVKMYAAQADNIARGATLENFDVTMAQAKSQFGAMQGELGWSDDERNANYDAFVGKNAYGLIVGTAAHDPARASAALDKYGSFFSPAERGVLQNQIQTAVDSHNAASVADEAFTHSTMTGADRAARNNNPLNVTNLAQGSWRGQVGSDGRFAQFATPQDGWNAADHNLQSYGRHGVDTLSAIINRWAPPGENDTGSYIATVAHVTGLDPNAKLDLTNAGVRSKILHAMAKVEGGGASTASGLDYAEEAAPQTLAAIAADPRLRGDPILINHAQSQFITNLSQARAVQNAATAGALDRLWTAAVQNNITDPSQLQKAYPQALADWTALGGKAQQNFTRQLTTYGNQATQDRTDNFLQVRGALVNPATAAAAAHQDLSKMDLTRGQYTQLVELQQNVIAKAAKATQLQANVSSALQLEPVKQALDNRPDLKIGSPGYNQFTGALSAQLEEWIADHPGKKPSEADKAAIATRLLAARPATWTVLGLDTGIKTSTTVPVVPPDEAARIRQQVEPSIGRQLSDFEIGRLYTQGQRRAR